MAREPLGAVILAEKFTAENAPSGSLSQDFGGNKNDVFLHLTQLAKVASANDENKNGRRTMATTKKTTSRNGKHQASGQWIRTDKRLAIYLRDNMTCIYCLRNLHGADPQDITLDHLQCQSDGGSNHETNLVTSCRSCNCSRQDKPLARFAGKETRAHIRRNTARKLGSYRKLAKAILSGEINHSDVNF